MVLAVVALVGGEVGHPEIRAQVDDLAAGRHEDAGEISRGAVREGEKPQVDVGPRRQLGGIGTGKGEGVGRGAAQGGDDRGQWLPGMLPRSDRRQSDVRMGEEELDQDFAGVTRRTNNADFHRNGGPVNAERRGGCK